MQDITSFKDKYRFLSNFWPAPVVLDGVTYPSTENAYQAAKTPAKRSAFVTCKPGDAKRMGKRNHIRADWEDVKLAVMEDLLRQKFAEDPLRRNLLDTGSVQLVEGNTWGDRYWGVCNGEGENNLGKLLMKIRDELRAKDGVA